MRKLCTAIGAALLAAALLLAPGSPANAADHGNGNTTCDRYEICLRDSRASDFLINGRHMHTYYWSSWNHDREYLYGEIADSVRVMDNVSGVWNRDSSCRVQLWHYNGNWFTYADLPLNYRGDAGYDINNAHTRCGG